MTIDVHVISINKNLNILIYICSLKPHISFQLQSNVAFGWNDLDLREEIDGYSTVTPFCENLKSIMVIPNKFEMDVTKFQIHVIHNHPNKYGEC